MKRLIQGLLSACVITRLGVTLEGGDFDTLRTGHSDAASRHYPVASHD